ncbi:MAG TPA: hypothetical protein VFE51_14090 [Verrucomicrobiae bacterium]|nr:hypothetical protein [Verrucomicrobiae bacterium]
MPFWDVLTRKRAEEWLYYQFLPQQVPGAVESEILEPNKSYANVWLRSTRVVNVRSGLKKFYGAVHSYISVLPVGQPDKAEVNTVVTPKLLRNVDPRNLDRVVQVNHRLLGPIAHSGHDVELEVGLFSVEEADLVAPYLGMLEKISDVAGVGFLKTALPFAAPIKDGINALLNGQGDSILEIGLSRVFQPLTTGYHLVMRVPEQQVNPAEFRLERATGRVVGNDGKLIKDYAYIVFEVASTKEKHDWPKISELKRQYDLIKDAIVRGDAKEANAGQQIFRRLARTSTDLIKADADRLTQLVRDEIDQSLGAPTPQAALTERLVREFDQLPLYPQK